MCWGSGERAHKGSLNGQQSFSRPSGLPDYENAIYSKELFWCEGVSAVTQLEQPLVCVVIATMNAKKHLQDCLDSIYEQTLPDWEIIIVDGGSTDGTLDVISANAGRLKYWVSEPDCGVYDAWNKALPHVSARWTVFLGADDRFWNDNVLRDAEPVLRAAACGPSRLVYGRVALTNGEGQLIRFEGRPWQSIAQKFEMVNCIPHQGVFHRRDLFDQNGFDASFRYAGDYALLLKEIGVSAPIFCNLCIAAWRQGGLTSKPGQSIDVLREFRKARSQAGLSGGHPHWIEFKALIKYYLVKAVGSQITELLLSVWRSWRAKMFLADNV